MIKKPPQRWPRQLSRNPIDDDPFRIGLFNEHLLSELGRSAIEGLGGGVCEVFDHGKKVGATLPRGLAVIVEQIFVRCLRMMPWLSQTQTSEGVYVMSKPTYAIYCGRQTRGNVDQALSGMLDAVRKPSKLTATLKRRALKNKAPRKSSSLALPQPPS
jgi:hypothetical protein